MLSSFTNFPRQKLPTSQKTEKWQNKCVDALLQNAYHFSGSSVRAAKRDIIDNYRLWDGELDEDSINWAVNPFGLSIKSFPENIPHYPILNNKLKVLIGEELSRVFEFSAFVVNSDAVSEKSKFIKDTIIDNLLKLALDDSATKEDYEKKAKELLKWAKYDATDIRERMANHILKYIYKEQNLKYKFNQGFKDFLIAGEEIYHIGTAGNKLVVRRCDPRSIIVLGLGNSPFVEDAEAIIEETYQSVSWVIDNYYDYLTPAQIDMLEKGITTEDSKNDSILNYTLPDIDLRMFSNTEDGYISVPDTYSNGYFDVNGNVKVSRVTWKTRRKIGVIKYYDEFGYQQTDLVDENYEPDPSLGEEVRWFWVNEWFEKTKIGKNIYVKGGPVSIQPRDMDNLSISRCPYVGTIYTTNGNPAKSLFQTLKPYSYLYDVIAYRLDKAIAKYQGPMIEMDFAKMPEGWTPEKWLYNAYETGYLYIDSFAESSKPHLRGTVSGHFNTSNKVINPDMGNYIKDLMGILQFIQEQVSTISGVTRQREGAIDTRESVGGVERAVTQSSLNTEDLFFIHENTKARVLETILEVAKVLFVENNTVLQYISEYDLQREILEIDGGLFSTANYGVVLVNGSEATKSKQIITQLIKTGLTNGLLNFSKVIDLLMSDSFASTRRKLEQYEDESMQIQIQQQQEQQKAQERMLQLEIQSREDQQAHEMELEKMKIDAQIEMKLLELDIKEKELELKEKSLGIDIDNSIQTSEKEHDLKLKELELKKEEINNKREESLLKIAQQSAKQTKI